MAYIPSEDEDQQSGMNVLTPAGQSQSQIQQEQQNLQPQGSAAPATSQPTAGQSNAASSGGKGSGTFTNLQKYMDANKPATQNIAKEVTKSSERQASQIGKQIQDQKSQFQQQVDANRARMQSAQNFANQQIQQAGQQPVDQSAVTRFQNILNQPNQFNQASADYSGIQNQVQNLQNLSDRSNRQDARMQLLRGAFGGDRYTMGQQALDDFLVASSPTAREQVAQAPVSAFQNLQSQLQDARQSGEVSRAALSRDEAAMKDALRSGVDTAQDVLRSDLEARRNAIATSLGSGPQLRDAIASGNVSQELLDTLGLDDNRLYGVDVNEYLTAAPTLEGIATQADLDRATALAQLEGTNQDILLDPSQVGTYEQAEADQLQRLRDAVAQRKGEYESESAGTRGLISDLERANELLPFLTQGAPELDRTYQRWNNERSAQAQANQELMNNFYGDVLARASEKGISKEAVELLSPFIAQQAGFNYEPGIGVGQAVNPLRDLSNQDSDSFRRMSRFATAIRNEAGGPTFADPQGILQALRDDLTGIQNRYDYQDVLGPIAAKDGAVKNAKLDVLKKLLNG